MARVRSLAECDMLIEARATRLVRLHQQGTKRVSYRELVLYRVQRNRALNLLIEAVELRDRVKERHLRNLRAIETGNTRRTLHAAGKRIRRSLSVPARESYPVHTRKGGK